MKNKAKFAVEEGRGNVFAGFRSPRPEWEQLGLRISCTRSTRCSLGGENLIDGDLAVIVRIASSAVEELRSLTKWQFLTAHLGGEGHRPEGGGLALRLRLAR